MRYEHIPRQFGQSTDRSRTAPKPIIGIANGIVASLAMWALIAGVVAVAT